MQLLDSVQSRMRGINSWTLIRLCWVRISMMFNVGIEGTLRICVQLVRTSKSFLRSQSRLLPSRCEKHPSFIRNFGLSFTQRWHNLSNVSCIASRIFWFFDFYNFQHMMFPRWVSPSSFVHGEQLVPMLGLNKLYIGCECNLCGHCTQPNPWKGGACLKTVKLIAGHSRTLTVHILLQSALNVDTK